LQNPWYLSYKREKNMMFINNSKKLMKDEKDKRTKENPMA
jgi:hypothetical protein